MTKRKVDAFDYAGHICKTLSKGVLLTTKAGEKVNTMTIGWGHIGVEWNRPIFVAYVRDSRFTSEMLEQNGEFTVNIPMDGCDSNVLKVCGTKSGRNMDKFAELGLTAVESDVISVPGIAQLPLTLECRVIYRQKQELSALPESIGTRFYPVTGEDGFRDPHTAYFGEIVNAYLIEE